MADLLGSILNSMQKPPEKSEKEKQAVKEQKEKMTKLQEEIRKEKEKFQTNMEEKIDKFVKDTSVRRYKFDAMDKLHRTVVYDISETAGLISQAFGRDDMGQRYIMLFKKDFPPSEAEIAAYRRGESWSEEKEIEDRKRVEEQKSREVAGSSLASCSHKSVTKRPPTRKQQHQLKDCKLVEPVGNYKDKYNHIIGKLAAKDAARATKANDTFGMVPSKNKRDVRSIEETLNAISAKKRKKREEEEKNST